MKFAWSVRNKLMKFAWNIEAKLMRVGKNLRRGKSFKIKDTVEGNVCEIITNLLREASDAMGVDVSEATILNGDRRLNYLGDKVDVWGDRKGLKKYIPTFEDGFDNLLVEMNNSFGGLKNIFLYNIGLKNPFQNTLVITVENDVPNIYSGFNPHLLKVLPSLNNSLSALIKEVNEGELNNKSLFNVLISLHDLGLKPGLYKGALTEFSYENAELFVYFPHKFTINRNKKIINITVNNDEILILKAIDLIDKALKLEPSNDYELRATYRC